MKKIWHYPVIASLAVLVWYIARLFIDNVVTDMFYFGAAFIVVAFPVWFAPFAAKRTRLSFIPSVYTVAVFLAPWSGALLTEYSNRQFPVELAVLIFALLLWNFICFIGFRILRYVKSRRKKAKEKKSAEAKTNTDSETEESNE